MKRLICAILSIAVCLSTAGALSVSAENDALALKYDDRYVFDGKTVSNITSDRVTSYKVGFGIDENSVLDDAVAVIDSENPSKIIATGTGTAIVTFTDNTSVRLNVSPADLTVFYLLGQSNAEGMDGDIAQSVVNEDGTAYSTFAPNNAWSGNKITGCEFTEGLSVATAPNFVAASLTDTKNVLGNELSYAPNGLCVSGNGKSGLDSAIAYQWHKLTGEKTWIINAAHSGSSIVSWDPDGAENNEYHQAAEVIKYAKQTAVNEYNAGHYNIKHIAYIWLQGESDNTMAADEYTNRFEALHAAFKQTMTMTLGNNEVTAEYGAMISARKCIDYPMYTYNDIPLNGQRVAHYYLANEQKYPDVIMISNIGDDWVQNNNERETGKLQAYFEAHYPDGALDYPTQNGTPNTIPKSCKEIHYGPHFSQVGYNEIGFDSASNLATVYGYVSDSGESEIRLLKQNGYEEYGDVINFAKDTEFTAVPVFKSLANTAKGEFSVELSDGITEVSQYKYKVTADCTITYHLPGGKTYSVKVNAVNYGDLNDDGKVNLLDLVLMRKYLANWSVTINEEAADLMHNGKINLVDLVYLRKLLVRIPVEVGPRYVS